MVPCSQNVSASAPSGSAPGPGECTHEMLKLCLDDAETSHLLFRAAEDLARAQAPDCITRAFVGATMTALQQSDGWCAPQARRSGGWLRRHWLVNSGRLWKQFVLRISSPSPQGRALIASDTPSGRSQTQILSVQCSPSTAWEHMTTCCGAAAEVAHRAQLVCLL